MRKGNKADKWAARSERLAAALRENLKRRKAQARARSGAGAGTAEPEGAGAKPQSPDFRRNPSGK
jgi:hypothetical protein